MKMINSRSFFWILTLALLGLAAPVFARDKAEDQLIADLNSPKDGVVTEALLKLEKKYPSSTQALPKIKSLVTDSRPKVRRKAARVLGALHAEVDANDLKNICALLKASDPQEVMDGLKSLRGLKAQSVLPEILPLLNSPTPNVARDACRAVGTLGTQANIPQIEPLLKSPNKAVAKDAADAIFQLKAKS